MIIFETLSKRFGKVEVLKELSLAIDDGGVFAILGPNGSGKTTLIKCLLGMTLPDQGSIHICDQNVRGAWTYRRELSYLPQIANFPANITVQELLDMIKNLRMAEAYDLELIESFGLHSFLSQKLSNLSGGTKQKVNLTLAFMFDTPLIILDEPTTGLDPLALIQLKDRIAKEKALGKTILITSHIMDFVEEMADQIVFILDGKIYFHGTVESIRQQTGQPTLERSIANILTPEHA